MIKKRRDACMKIKNEKDKNKKTSIVIIKYSQDLLHWMMGIMERLK